MSLYDDLEKDEPPQPPQEKKRKSYMPVGNLGDTDPICFSRLGRRLEATAVAYPTEEGNVDATGMLKHGFRRELVNGPFFSETKPVHQPPMARWRTKLRNAWRPNRLSLRSRSTFPQR